MWFERVGSLATVIKLHKEHLASALSPFSLLFFERRKKVQRRSRLLSGFCHISVSSFSCVVTSLEDGVTVTVLVVEEDSDGSVAEELGQIQTLEVCERFHHRLAINLLIF